MATSSALRRAWLRLTDSATLPGDSRDEKLHKRLQIAMSASSIPVISGWGLSFVAIGHARVALWHLAYVALTIALLALLRATRRYALFRAPHTALVLLLPFGLHYELGGFAGSGGALLWGLIAPVAAMMFLGPRRSIPWIAALVALVLVGWPRERFLAAPSVRLSAAAISGYFALNTIGMGVFMYLSTRYFVSRLEREQERSDRLLLNVLPASVAERLKREDRVIAERFGEVTVLFSDLVPRRIRPDPDQRRHRGAPRRRVRGRGAGDDRDQGEGGDGTYWLEARAAPTAARSTR